MFLEVKPCIRATGGNLFRTGTSLKIALSPPTQFRFSKKLPDFKCLGLPTARSLPGLQLKVVQLLLSVIPQA